MARATGLADRPHRDVPDLPPGSIEELQRLSHEDPFDEVVHARYGEALESAHRAAQGSPGAPCRCGSGRPYRACCQARDRRGLRRFTERRPLYRLRDRLLDYFEDPEFEPVRRLALEAWLGEEAPGPDEDMPAREDPDAPHLFAYEWAFSMLPVHGGAAHDHCLLECFASNPDTPPVFAAHALDWLDGGRWGLWRCSSAPAPGVWLTDLLSGMRRYVSIPPEQMQGHPASMVAIGQIFPMDGVWRTGGALAFTSVDMGAAIAATLLDARDELLVEQVHHRERPRRGAPPRSPSPEELDQATSWMVGMTLPRLSGLPEKPGSCAAAAGQ